MGRQVHGEPGAPAGLGFHVDPAPVLLHDAVGDGEPQPRALVLGGEKRVEGVGQGLGVHAGPGVLHRHPHPVVPRPGHPDPDLPALGGHLQGVDRQVQEELLELFRVALDLRVRPQVEGEPHPLAAALLLEGAVPFQGLGHPHGPGLHRLGPGEVQKAPDQGLQAVDLGVHVGHEAPAALAEPRLLREHVEADRHAGQGVSDLVGDAGRELADRGEPCHALDPLVEPPTLGQVLHDHGGPPGRRLAHGHHADEQVAQARARAQVHRHLLQVGVPFHDPPQGLEHGCRPQVPLHRVPLGGLPHLQEPPGRRVHEHHPPPRVQGHDPVRGHRKDGVPQIPLLPDLAEELGGLDGLGRLGREDREDLLVGRGEGVRAAGLQGENPQGLPLAQERHGQVVSPLGHRGVGPAPVHHPKRPPVPGHPARDAVPHLHLAAGGLPARPGGERQPFGSGHPQVHRPGVGAGEPGRLPHHHPQQPLQVQGGGHLPAHPLHGQQLPHPGLVGLVEGLVLEGQGHAVGHHPHRGSGPGGFGPLGHHPPHGPVVAPGRGAVPDPAGSRRVRAGVRPGIGGRNLGAGACGHGLRRRPVPGGPEHAHRPEPHLPQHLHGAPGHLGGRTGGRQGRGEPDQGFQDLGVAGERLGHGRSGREDR